MSYLDPYEISKLFKLNHLQLDNKLRNLKERIDHDFENFRLSLLAALNHLNYIRYHESYPNDDFKFIFKEKVNASKAQSRLQQKEEIMKRMSQFSTIRQDTGGISDNCIWEIEQILSKAEGLLDFKTISPTANSFLRKNKEVLSEYEQFWRVSQGKQSRVNDIFAEMSPVFQRTELKKLGSIFSQMNKSIVSAKLLFRASQHNFQSALFKQFCAGKSPTLMIAKSDKGNIFGGYTPVKWLNTKQKQYVGDATATSFLFSLDNNLVFPIKKNQLDYAISAYGGWGPIYGSPYGPDLSISDKCHMNDNSCSSLGSHYDIPINFKQYSVEVFSLLAGAKKFKVVEYQIYEIRLQ